MNIKNFYPTPKHLIRKMLKGVNSLDKYKILEPSAGKGDILDYIIENATNSFPYDSQKKDKIIKATVDCIEIDKKRKEREKK